MLNLNTKVWCTFDVIGFHRWPRAPKDVSYLRSMHRHVFKFKVAVSVPHPERAVEFHTLKAHLKQLLSEYEEFGDVQTVEGGYAYNFGGRSCEMIAVELIDAMVSSNHHYGYHSRYISVEVSEDGENGAIVEYTPDKD